MPQQGVCGSKLFRVLHRSGIPLLFWLKGLGGEPECIVDKMHFGERERVAAAPIFHAVRAARRRGFGERARAPDHVRARRQRLREASRICRTGCVEAFVPSENEVIAATAEPCRRASCASQDVQDRNAAAQAGVKPK